MKIFCCKSMEYQLTNVCELHGIDCPDNVVKTYASNQFGIRHPDDGSFYKIRYCPWCGINLDKKYEIKKGDIVEIISNIPFLLKDKPKPILGRVTKIDGSYITVKPKYKRFECEFYSSELKKI